MIHYSFVVLLGATVLVWYRRQARSNRIRWTDRREVRPQSKFGKALADTSSKPFVHLDTGLNSLQTATDTQKHPFRERTPQKPDCLAILERCAERPPGAVETNVQFINTPKGLDGVAAELKQCDVLGFDVEHNHKRSYNGMSCLLQLFTGHQAYVVDLLELHASLGFLRPIFANPNILKVVHGGENDILWLQRDFHIYVQCLFDTEKACLALGKKERSLSALLMEYAQVKQDKSFQLRDWRQRPLDKNLMRYAAVDAIYLPFLAFKLRRELLVFSAADEPGKQLAIAFSNSEAVAMCLYHKTSPEAAVQQAFSNLMKRWKAARVYKKGASRSAKSQHPSPEVQRRAAALCQWRDSTARNLDEGIQHIMEDELLMRLAYLDHPDLDSLLGACSDHLDEIKLRTELHWIIKEDAQKICELLAHPPELGTVLIGSSNAAPDHSRKLSKEDRRSLVAQKFSAKRKVYENCRMLSQDGRLLCFCDMRKINWYEGKGLGERVSDDPVTIRLMFEHKVGDQDAGQDAFYTASRDNCCVVCGSHKHLLRYRVVPACYRKCFPVQQKSHRSHDVVLLCFECHELAQKAAEDVKRHIARDTGIPLYPPVRGLDARSDAPFPGATQVRMAAIALNAAGDRMPPTRQRQLEGIILRFFHEDGQEGDGEEQEKSDDVHGSASHGRKCPGLPEGLLEQALLVGLGPKRRRRLEKRHHRQEAEKGSSDEQRNSENAEVDSDKQKDWKLSVDTQDAGHMWHGRQIVERLLERGGEEALNSMIQRFRAAFVDTTHPQHLPSFWQVDHNAVRQFGDYSVYSKDKKSESGH